VTAFDEAGNANAGYCFAEQGELYVIYLRNAENGVLDLSGASGSFSVKWFNPRSGGARTAGSVKSIRGGGVVSLGAPPSGRQEDWVAVVCAK